MQEPGNIYGYTIMDYNDSVGHEYRATLGNAEPSELDANIIETGERMLENECVGKSVVILV
jgi:hypothetical protein